MRHGTSAPRHCPNGAGFRAFEGQAGAVALCHLFSLRHRRQRCYHPVEALCLIVRMIWNRQKQRPSEWRGPEVTNSGRRGVIIWQSLIKPRLQIPSAKQLKSHPRNLRECCSRPFSKCLDTRHDNGTGLRQWTKASQMQEWCFLHLLLTLTVMHGLCSQSQTLNSLWETSYLKIRWMPTATSRLKHPTHG